MTDDSKFRMEAAQQSLLNHLMEAQEEVRFLRAEVNTMRERLQDVERATESLKAVTG